MSPLRSIRGLLHRKTTAPCCALIFWLHAALAPCAFAQQYPFLPVPGSPKNVAGLFQDSRGRLWMGAEQAAVFDGSRFFLLRDYGFPDASIYDFAEDPGGGIWIGSDSGVFRFWNGRMEQIAKGVAISVVAVSADTALASVGPAGRGTPTDTQLIRMQRRGEAWKVETVMDLESPGRLALDHSGMLLYPWPPNRWNELRLDDVLHWRSGPPPPVIHHDAPGFSGYGNLKVMRDRAGCVWTGITGAAAYDCGQGRKGVPFEHNSPEGILHEAPNGDIVLWGGSVLKIGRPGSFREARPANGLPPLADAIEARDGTIWLATPQGLCRFAYPFQLEYWTVREGLQTPTWSMGRVGEKIYAGLTDQIAVLSRDRLRWESFVSLKGGDVTSLLGLDDGTLAASVMYSGTGLYSADGRMLAHTQPDHPKGAHMRLARGPGGEIWLGSLSLGPLKRQGTILKYEEHPLPPGRHGDILSIHYETHTRKLWACYTGGVLVRDEAGAWQQFTTKDGLQVNGCWSLVPLPNGDVWDTYYQNVHALGLIRLGAAGGIAVRHYGPGAISEPQDEVVGPDGHGRLWRGGGTSYYVADPANAEAGRWLTLDESDGFRPGMNTGSYFADPDGSGWWGADNDLVHYQPAEDLVDPKFSPQVFVSAFSWQGAAPKMAEAIDRVPHGSKATAHIGSLQFDRRSALRVRYRILPEQPAWRESAGLDVPLDKLSSGAHALEVQGRVFTGPWSSSVTRSFTVLPPLWRATPLLWGYGMASVMLAAGAYALQRKRKADRKPLLPDLGDWRSLAFPKIGGLADTVLDLRFEVGKLMGQGGFAHVFAGYDRVENRRCAIKIFRDEVKDKAWMQQRFTEEVAALEKVRHPNVVAIYAHGNAPSGAAYLVMEFIEGRSLRAILAAGALAPRRVARFLQQLAGALDAIHAQGVCHRDVKPENVIVRNDGAPQEEAVLIDFSIAIVKDVHATIHGLSRVAGSLYYMAPEQIQNHAAPSSDIYSLAKVVIELLTGRQLEQILPPTAFPLPNPVRALLGDLNIGLSRESIEMLATALEFDPANRPRAAASAFATSIVRDLDSQAGEL